MNGMPHILVIDKSAIFREGLIRIIASANGAICSGCSSLTEVDGACAEGEPVLFLVNLGQDRKVLVDGIHYLRDHFPDEKIVVLSARYSQAHMLWALNAGARGYLSIDTSCEVLIRSLELVMLGEIALPAEALALLSGTDSPGLPTPLHFGPSRVLSPREVEVLSSLSQGRSNKHIARQWGISEGTVKVHVKAILRKIQVKSRVEAALWARDHDPDSFASPTRSNGTIK